VAPSAPNRERQRAAYLITFVCYGSWLHGREGSVDREHNMPGSPRLAEDLTRQAMKRRLMAQPPYILDERRRAAVLEGVKEACSRRGWTLLAAHIRPCHVHAVVEADRGPEQVMNSLKAYASRTLNQTGCDDSDRRGWARHGSTRYLWTPAEIAAAVHYVVGNQGAPMAVHAPNRERSERLPTPLPASS